MGTGIERALRWDDGKPHPLPQDFSHMLGWEEMAKKVSEAYKKLSEEEKEKTIIFCDNYGMAGALKYYSGKYTLPEVHSDKAEFLYWIPDSLHYENIIMITDDTNELHRSYTSRFRSAEVADSMQTKYASERGNVICILKGASAEFKHFFSNKISTTRKNIHYRSN